MASYEFTKDITEEEIIVDAKTDGIYEETDLAHVKQVCERHIVKGEKLLKEDGSSNLFWVRNKNGELCGVNVWLRGVGWNVSVDRFSSSFMCGLVGDRSFFRN